MALYIYRVEWTCPARNPITRSKSMKISSYIRTLLGPVRPVGSCRIGYIVTDQSDRLGRPVRPVGLVCCQFWSSTYAPLFFGKAWVPKNTLLDQNCLKAMIHDTSAIFCAKGDKNYRPCLAFLQVDDESICFGLQTFFMAIGFVGLTSTSCPIVSCLRKRCNLRFWVRDKPEGHHLGCKYFESCLTSSLLQLKSLLTRSLLATIGLCGEA